MPATATQAADPSVELQATLDEVTARVARLPARHERAAGALLRAALQDVTRSMAAWLAMGPGADVRYTARRHRVAMLQLRTAIEGLKPRLSEPLAAEMMAGDARARTVSGRNLRAEVVAGAHAFGTGEPMDVAKAVEMDRGERWRVKHYAASAGRYAGRVGKDIRRQLAMGVALGETFDQMTARLQRLGGPRGLVSMRGVAGQPGAIAQRIEEGLFKRYRHWAERLVRTELIAAHNRHHVAQIEELDKADPGYVLRWDSTADKRTCALCRGLHGKVIAIDGTFGIPRTVPTSRRHPPAHPSCRCAVVAWRPEWDLPLPEAAKVKPKPKRPRAPAKSKAVTRPSPDL